MDRGVADGPGPRRRPLGASLRRAALAVAWLALAGVIALGAAGIVAAIDHLPDGPGRPELTWTADRAVAPELDAAAADLSGLVDAVDVLGGDGRQALAALVGGDTPTLDAAIAAGTAQLDVIDAAAEQLRSRLAALSLAGPGRGAFHSAETLARHDALEGALAAVAPLRSAWERLAVGVLPATELTGHLLEHDRIAGQAIRLGGAGSYRSAIARIDRADQELVAATKVRDVLAASVDVGTLDEWIARNRAYDAAVRGLWDALRRSGGRVTDTVRSAATAESRARRQLPADAQALVVILGDVARGGLNQAVITIEEARGTLLAALAAAGPVPAPSPSAAAPTPAPGGGSSPATSAGGEPSP